MRLDVELQTCNPCDCSMSVRSVCNVHSLNSFHLLPARRTNADLRDSSCVTAETTVTRQRLLPHRLLSADQLRRRNIGRQASLRWTRSTGCCVLHQKSAR